MDNFRVITSLMGTYENTCKIAVLITLLLTYYLLAVDNFTFNVPYIYLTCLSKIVTTSDWQDTFSCNNQALRPTFSFSML